MPAPRGVFTLLVAFTLVAAVCAALIPQRLAAASPSWPVSRGLVVAEVMTGGASASDEYVEIANAGSPSADLGGCDLVYVTASGATLTRKAIFAEPLLLTPGQHLLVANSAGIFGPLADYTYSGGLAADGGAIALRGRDGTVIDAVGWGAAAKSFVEGSAAPAPPAKSSIERLPGGAAGNTQDTNDNLADWFVQPNPVPQSLVSAPAPVASTTPSVTAAGSAAESGGPSGTATPTPELTVTPVASTDATPTSSTPTAEASSTSPGVASPTDPVATRSPQQVEITERHGHRNRHGHSDRDRNRPGRRDRNRHGRRKRPADCLGFVVREADQHDTDPGDDRGGPRPASRGARPRRGRGHGRPRTGRRRRCARDPGRLGRDLRPRS